MKSAVFTLCVNQNWGCHHTAKQTVALTPQHQGPDSCAFGTQEIILPFSKAQALGLCWPHVVDIHIAVQLPSPGLRSHVILLEKDKLVFLLRGGHDWGPIKISTILLRFLENGWLTAGHVTQAKVCLPWVIFHDSEWW